LMRMSTAQTRTSTIAFIFQLDGQTTTIWEGTST
jgi:hypothetical protein